MSEPTVLIVDDEKNLADLFAMYLEGHYDTRVVYSGDEALEKLDSSIDVMLLDRRMPSYSGDKVAAAVRSEGWDCAIIFVSAVAKDTDAGVSADDYLEKPVDREELIAIVKKHS